MKNLLVVLGYKKLNGDYDFKELKFDMLVVIGAVVVGGIFMWLWSVV